MKNLFNSVVKAHHNKAFGVALNYYSPVKQLNKSKEPLVFQKSLSALAHNPSELSLTTPSKINHEGVFLLIIDKIWKNSGIGSINIGEMRKSFYYVGGYFLLLDLTANAISNYRKEGKSFCLTKNLNGFFVVGDFLEKNLIGDPHNINLELKVNSKIRQNGNTNQMMFNINEQIAYLSRFVPLNPGDLLLTGTPDGIDFFESGDVLEARMMDPAKKVISELKLKINYQVFDPTKIE